MLIDKALSRTNQIVNLSRLTGYIVNVKRSPVIKRLMVRGSQVALKHVIHDMDIDDENVSQCGGMDHRLKILHSAKVECGFRTTPEECLYNSGLISLQYRAS